jgi:xanthine dehydrogenase YagT iron-sulfur-binding subunit
MAKDDGRERRGVSRRDFLRGSAAGALAPGLLGGAAALQGSAAAADTGAGPAAGKVVGPGPVPMRFLINGRTHEAELEPRVTLLDALRERFGLTGAKRVCDRGTCGACTVLVDGRTAYACSILAIEVAIGDGPVRAIETVESLGTPEDLHPVQAAFVENDAQQCGFCTPGFVVSAAALLADNPDPTPEEAEHGLAGNYCRCGTYAGIRKVMETGGRRG